jgi:hypothetical protein
MVKNTEKQVCAGAFCGILRLTMSEILSEQTKIKGNSEQEKYTPTCYLCGNQHWPLDPSCGGKKGGKANAKAKAKADRKAEKDAKRLAKLELKAQAKGDRKLTKAGKSDDNATSFADKITHIQTEAADTIAHTEHQANVQIQTERQIRERVEAESQETIRAYAEELARVSDESADRLARERKRFNTVIEDGKLTQLEAEKKAIEFSKRLEDSQDTLRKEVTSREEIDGRFKDERAKRIELERHLEHSANAYEEEAYKLK